MKGKAFILCRISDVKQEDGYSLDAQEKFGREYCKKEDLELIKIFKFIESASKIGKRTRYDEMYRELKSLMRTSKEAVHLVVEKPDRLTRNLTNKEQMEEHVMKGHLIIHYYKDRRIFDKFSTPADIFTEDMMATVSKYMAKNTARETMKGMTEKANQGWFPGHAPLGYMNVRDGLENKHGRKEAFIAINPEEKDGVLRMFELRAQARLSYQAIKDTLIEERRFPPSKLKYLHKSTIEKTLKNPFYGGSFKFKDVIYQGKHECFVPARWIRAVAEMEGAGAKKRPMGVFSNFLTCGNSKCGCAILYDPKKKTNKKTGAFREYKYYHCSDGRGVHRAAEEKQVNVSEEILWDQFARPMRDIHISEALADAISKALRKANDKAVAAHMQVMEQYRQKILVTEQEEDDLVELLMSGVIDKELFRRKTEKTKEERRRYEALLEKGQEAITNVFYVNSEKILELSKNAETLWKSRSEQERLDFLKRVLSNQMLEGSNLIYELKKPFSAILDIKKADSMVSFLDWCPGRDLNPHACALDPKSSVSANFTTGATPFFRRLLIAQKCAIMQAKS
ncbi:recombinase [Bdellovibrio bacteriovorus W]|nr:recombinase [Bdellovibrio bacteriovorus W]